jgi:enolase
VYYDRGLSTAVGDEGGFAPTLAGTEDAWIPLNYQWKMLDILLVMKS